MSYINNRPLQNPKVKSLDCCKKKSSIASQHSKQRTSKISFQDNFFLPNSKMNSPIVCGVSTNTSKCGASLSCVQKINAMKLPQSKCNPSVVNTKCNTCSCVGKNSLVMNKSTSHRETKKCSLKENPEIHIIEEIVMPVKPSAEKKISDITSQTVNPFHKPSTPISVKKLSAQLSNPVPSLEKVPVTHNTLMKTRKYSKNEDLEKEMVKKILPIAFVIDKKPFQSLVKDTVTKNKTETMETGFEDNGGTDSPKTDIGKVPSTELISDYHQIKLAESETNSTNPDRGISVKIDADEVKSNYPETPEKRFPAETTPSRQILQSNSKNNEIMETLRTDTGKAPVAKGKESVDIVVENVDSKRTECPEECSPTENTSLRKNVYLKMGSTENMKTLKNDIMEVPSAEFKSNHQPMKLRDSEDESVVAETNYITEGTDIEKLDSKTLKNPEDCPPTENTLLKKHSQLESSDIIRTIEINRKIIIPCIEVKEMNIKCTRHCGCIFDQNETETNKIEMHDTPGKVTNLNTISVKCCKETIFPENKVVAPANFNTEESFSTEIEIMNIEIQEIEPEQITVVDEKVNRDEAPEERNRILSLPTTQIDKNIMSQKSSLKGCLCRQKNLDHEIPEIVANIEDNPDEPFLKQGIIYNDTPETDPDEITVVDEEIIGKTNETPRECSSAETTPLRQILQTNLESPENMDTPRTETGKSSSFQINYKKINPKKSSGSVKSKKSIEIVMEKLDSKRVECPEEYTTTENTCLIKNIHPKMENFEIIRTPKTDIGKVSSAEESKYTHQRVNLKESGGSVVGETNFITKGVDMHKIYSKTLENPEELLRTENTILRKNIRPRLESSDVKGTVEVNHETVDSCSEFQMENIEKIEKCECLQRRDDTKLDKNGKKIIIQSSEKAMAINEYVSEQVVPMAASSKRSDNEEKIRLSNSKLSVVSEKIYGCPSDQCKNEFLEGESICCRTVNERSIVKLELEKEDEPGDYVALQGPMFIRKSLLGCISTSEQESQEQQTVEPIISDTVKSFLNCKQCCREGKCIAKKLLHICESDPEAIIEMYRSQIIEQSNLRVEDLSSSSSFQMQKTHGEIYGDQKYHFLMVDKTMSVDEVKLEESKVINIEELPEKPPESEKIKLEETIPIKLENELGTLEDKSAIKNEVSGTPNDEEAAKMNETEKQALKLDESDEPKKIEVEKTDPVEIKIPEIETVGSEVEENNEMGIEPKENGLENLYHPKIARTSTISWGTLEQQKPILSETDDSLDHLADEARKRRERFIEKTHHRRKKNSAFEDILNEEKRKTSVLGNFKIEPSSKNLTKQESCDNAVQTRCCGLRKPKKNTSRDQIWSRAHRKSTLSHVSKVDKIDTDTSITSVQNLTKPDDTSSEGSSLSSYHLRSSTDENSITEEHRTFSKHLNKS
nr:uncharacterized protein LOC111514457 [Leptinotarsa decemlineata]